MLHQYLYSICLGKCWLPLFFFRQVSVNIEWIKISTHVITESMHEWYGAPGEFYVV